MTSLEAELRRLRDAVDRRFTQLSGSVDARFIPVASTFNTLTDFEPAVAPYDGGPFLTDGTPWTATITSNVIGKDGNGLRISFVMDEGASRQIDVHDHEYFAGSWLPLSGNVGVHVMQENPPFFAPLTVLDLEMAINASSSLAFVSTADASPSKILNTTDNGFSGSFSGGSDFR